MRTGIGIGVVVAIGLIWSVAAMLEWGPREQRGHVGCDIVARYHGGAR